jgi:hypothetical protein
MAEFNNVLKTIIDFVSFFYVFFYDSNLIYQFFANLFCPSNNDNLIMLMKIVTKVTILTLVIIATGVFIAIENNISTSTSALAQYLVVFK